MTPDPVTPGWLPDERVTAGRENLDPVHAADYDRKEDAGSADEVALLQRLGLEAASEVVDLGAGTGQFVLAVAPLCSRVVAVDVSPVMLGVLRERVLTSQLANVEVVQSGFLTYEHRGAPPDFIYSRFALHHLPDVWKVLALHRMRGLLEPGGVLRLWDVVYDFPPGEITERMEAWCATLDHGQAEGWTRADIEEHIRDEFSTFTWLLEPMLERCGFNIDEAEYSPDGIFARYLARAI